jgi:hypothetical protein
MVAIETDVELEVTLEMIEILMEKEELTAEEDLLLSELIAAAEEYEDIHYPIEKMVEENVNAYGKWNVGLPGGPAGPFFSVVKPNGNIVAMQIVDRETADMIAAIPAYQAALLRIASYVAPDQIEVDFDETGLTFTEYIEMAYDNIRQEAISLLKQEGLI